MKKKNTYGALKELEAYKTTWVINGEEWWSYSYRYTGDRFERPIKKAYKISVHHSYRKNGKVQKKQWVICTMSYYGIADNGSWIGDYMLRGVLEEKLKDMNITEEKLCEMVYNKLNPLIEQIKKEYELTEEYKTHEEYKKIIDKYLKAKGEFKNKYGSDNYDYYYDVLGVLREKEKFEVFKRQYEASKEYQRSYYENFKSNYNSNYNFSSYSDTKQSNYTDKEKGYLKTIYRSAAAKLHPDITGDNEGMQFLNKLKEQWGL